VLGPLLFLLYVNDIADNLLSLTRLFADDTSLSYSSQSPYTIEDVINSDLESISIWSKPGADPGFQVRGGGGGAHIKKLHRIALVF
jgi:hypothetical protein